jgi:hypothetical protein
MVAIHNKRKGAKGEEKAGAKPCGAYSVQQTQKRGFGNTDLERYFISRNDSPAATRVKRTNAGHGAFGISKYYALGPR